MESFNTDLLHSPSKSIWRRILGGLYILVGVSWLILRIVSNEPLINKPALRFFDFVYSGFFGLAGLIFVIDSFGISISRWFGEAYIKIDNEGLFIKKGVFSKELAIRWEDIKKVEFTVIGIIFSLRDGNSQDLDYDNLDYKTIQQVKEITRSIAEEKGKEIVVTGSVIFR